MKFFTHVISPSYGFEVCHDDNVVLLGACFAELVGGRLAANKFHVISNPTGVLYNPASIFKLLNTSLSWGNCTEDAVVSSWCFEHGGMWRSWLHDTSFSYDDREVLLSCVRETLCALQSALRLVDVIFLTFGTSHAYRLRSSGLIVSNCHKVEPSLFEEVCLSVEDIVTMGSEIIEHLVKLRPSVMVVLTISPYRYSKYGFHGNQVSKATLLLAVETLVERYPDNIRYFPAYEIVCDELRDYRYYAEDMLHVSGVAAEYIWERFVQDWLSENSQRFIAEWHSVQKDLGHRPLNARSVEYRLFLQGVKRKIECFAMRYPRISFLEELSEVDRRLKQID